MRTVSRTGRLSWRTRLLLILMSLTPFILLEAGLWIFGFQGLVDDPYRGFVGHNRVFLRDGDRMRPDPTRRDLVRHQPSFAARKVPGTFRVFCVGDSMTWAWEGRKAVEGYPEKLQRMLEERHPGRSFEIVNSGVVRFASFRLVGVMREVLQYEPDMVTLLTGASEFLEARSYREWGKRRDREASWIRHWKTLTLLRELIADSSSLSREGEELGERDAYLKANFLDERFIVRDAAEIRATLDHSAHNIRMMVEMCRAVDVPILLLTSPSNLRFPPFRTVAQEETTDSLVRRTNDLIKAGRVHEAIRLLTPAIERDPAAAALHYRMGEALDIKGDSARAAEAYLRAKDCDAFPHRALSRFNQDVRRISREPGAHLVDMVKVFSGAVSDGIPDYRLFSDNCHPRSDAHEFMAGELLEAIETLGVLE